MKASRMHLAAIKPLSPNGAPVPPDRKTSMTRVVGPESPEWDNAIAAAQGVYGSAIDTSTTRKASGDEFDTLGFLRPTFGMVKPGALIADGS